jgi:hypothetical protein
MTHIEPNVEAPLFKMAIRLPKDAWHGYETETVWVEGTKDGELRLRNTPFFAKDLSYMDIVKVVIEGDELVFSDVSQRGLHSTYRLVVEPTASISEIKRRLAELSRIGCTYEFFEGLQLYAFDIPANVNVDDVYALLSIGEKEGLWSFEEGHFYRAH